MRFARSAIRSYRLTREQTRHQRGREGIARAHRVAKLHLGRDRADRLHAGHVHHAALPPSVMATSFKPRIEREEFRHRVGGREVEEGGDLAHLALVELEQVGQRQAVLDDLGREEGRAQVEVEQAQRVRRARLQELPDGPARARAALRQRAEAHGVRPAGEQRAQACRSSPGNPTPSGSAMV